MRNLREKMAEMSLRVERLERIMPLGCEESGSSSGGGEWALWSWRLVGEDKHENELNKWEGSASISQSLGKSSEKMRLCDEKTPDTSMTMEHLRRCLSRPGTPIC